jgi:hypothetical protein
MKPVCLSGTLIPVTDLNYTPTAKTYETHKTKKLAKTGIELSTIFI